MFDFIETVCRLQRLRCAVTQTLSLRVHQSEPELQTPAESIITRLVQLLTADNISSRVMVSALRALSTLCVGLGYAPRPGNQRAAADAGALARLLQLTTPYDHQTTDDDDDDDGGSTAGGGGDSDDMALVRVEASLTFALLQLGIRRIEVRFDNLPLLSGEYNVRCLHLVCCQKIDSTETLTFSILFKFTLCFQEFLSIVRKIFLRFFYLR